VTDPRTQADVVVAVDATSQGVGYEPPRLVPIGNVHDLLAGDGGTQCDQIDGKSTGHDDPSLC
jgi:hypothetical protein